MNKLFAFGWLVIIGTNVAGYNSETAPYQGAVILAGTVYFLLVFHRQFLRLVFFPDYFLVLLMLGVPVLLMLLSNRSFDRGEYTSQVSAVMVFVVASVLASRVNLDRERAIAAFVIVSVAAALNLYELFLENNVWSLSPGRSAGFYVNPNVSGEALLGYGLVFLTARSSKLGIADLVLMALILAGVFATFSRTGILASLLLLTVVALMRVQRKHIPRVAAGGIAISLFAFVFAFYVIHNLDLSEDATLRVFSLLEEGGVGDYQEARGDAISASFDLVFENPVFGAGVRTALDLPPQGPHNMFVAMMVDYGIAGVIVYLTVIIRLLLIARRADRNLSGTILLYVAWLIIFSLASHNLMTSVSSLPLLGFALAHACQIQYLARLRRVNQ